MAYTLESCAEHAEAGMLREESHINLALITWTVHQ